MNNGHFTIWCSLESQKVQKCYLMLNVTMKDLRLDLWELRVGAGTVALLRFSSMRHILFRKADISAQLVSLSDGRASFHLF